MKTLLYCVVILLISSCASHQYESFDMQDSRNGHNYRVDEQTLTVQYQEYQFVPNTTEVLIKCRETSKEVAQELNIEIIDFDYTTERNGALGITSCLAFGEILQKVKNNQ